MGGRTPQNTPGAGSFARLGASCVVAGSSLQNEDPGGITPAVLIPFDPALASLAPLVRAWSWLPRGFRFPCECSDEIHRNRLCFGNTPRSGIT